MTVNMVDNIRRIGIFMIAAQTVMHFAAGKQYEKYIKIVTGVIVLLLFLDPFTSSSGNIGVDWQTEIEQIDWQMQSDMQQNMLYTSDSVETVVLRQIEQEIKAMLNDTVTGMDCSVTDVVIDLEEIDGDYGTGENQKGQNWEFQRVKVTLQGMDTVETCDESEDRTIRIEEIKVGQGTEDEAEGQEKQNLDQDTKRREYQRIFAQTLGIAYDRVEVIYSGGW